MLHTWLLYPALLFLLGGRKAKSEVPENYEPEICIICAAYNEEKVIEEKIRTTFATNYPFAKIKLLIGTDACTDNTVTIIKSLQTLYPGIELVEFTSRTGKIGILNKLCEKAASPVLVMTDANVYFEKDTLHKLVKPFANENTGMVCGRILKKPANTGAVTQTELRYMNLENRLKMAESNLFNLVIGAEGGCYAMRKELYRPVPAHFIADDFYTTCTVLRAGKKIVFEEAALANEELTADTRGEFRRKARIATGNFQNLFHFFDILIAFWRPASFAFFSHKVLRWLTPFLYLLALATGWRIINEHVWFTYTYWTLVSAMILLLLNYIAVKSGLKLKILLALNHFFVMNLALVVGFFRFCGGVRSSVWEPVKR